MMCWPQLNGVAIALQIECIKFYDAIHYNLFE